jgi:hypothetical protein
MALMSAILGGNVFGGDDETEKGWDAIRRYSERAESRADVLYLAVVVRRSGPCRRVGHASVVETSATLGVTGLSPRNAVATLTPSRFTFPLALGCIAWGPTPTWPGRDRVYFQMWSQQTTYGSLLLSITYLSTVSSLGRTPRSHSPDAGYNSPLDRSTKMRATAAVAALAALLRLASAVPCVQFDTSWNLYAFGGSSDVNLGANTTWSCESARVSRRCRKDSVCPSTDGFE